MRRVLLTVTLLILAALPLCAQRRGVGSAPRSSFAPRVGVSVRANSHGGFGFRGGIGFGQSPRVGVFLNQRPLRRRFFYPYSYYYPYSYAYPYGYTYPYTIYPYYGYQSDFVYSGSAMQTPPAYMSDHDTGLQNDVYRLQAELDQMRQEQALRADQQQYVSPGLMQTPRSSQPARPEPPAPPTVLTFRDGHQAEVLNYAVSGQTLWIFSEERARKVPLADLDLDATRQANEQRGVEFAVRPNPAP